MDKRILEQYIDACALIKETEVEIQRLRKRKEVTQDSVRGSNPEFPYQPQNFRIQGTRETMKDRNLMDEEEKLLEERKENANRIKRDVEQWMNRIPMRMQRIIKWKLFDGLTWQQVARKLGPKATENSVKKEFERFYRKQAPGN